MTMLKDVISYSVESSSTTTSSGPPTSATSISPEGSSLLYEKANKGLGLAQDFMVEQTEHIQLVPLKVAVGPLEVILFLLVHFQVHFVLKNQGNIYFEACMVWCIYSKVPYTFIVPAELNETH